MKKNYILGLDIGISSIGWALLILNDRGEPYKIIDVGSRIFTPGEIEKTGDSRAKERREKRGARRITRRRAFRLDRVRNLLYETGYLNATVTSNIVSIKNEELTSHFNNIINKYYKNKDTNPYKLKVEALDRKLNNEELCIVLVHYAKKRGYKSNREENTDNDFGKVKSAIKENESLMVNNNYRTISEMYITDKKFKDKIKNTTGDYKISVTNQMYLEEINKVLDKQIKFGLITEEFKEEYLEIYNSRRNYSDGPGYYYKYDKEGNRIKKRSPYGGNLIEKMTGKCKYDDEPRAPKKAYSSEMYVALTKLINLRYKIDNENYIELNSTEVNTLINKAKEKNKITYLDLTKIIEKDNIKIKDLSLSKKDYKKVINELKKKLNINPNEALNINTLSEEEKNIYNKIYQKELFGKTLIELKGYHELKNAYEKSFGKENWEKVKDNMLLLDELALYCTNYKLSEQIKEKIINSEIIPNELADDNFIDALPNFKEHLMLSTSIIRKLIPHIKDGKRYDEAMKIIGYAHTDTYQNKEKSNLLVPINTCETITNQRVMRSLTQARKVINAIIKKYGTPKIINIETARELAKSREERREIEKNQQERREKNEEIKKYLVELGIFTSPEKISSNDILKYKLWEEQKEFCPYCLKKISIEDLYTNNTVQIDHILPYSRTYNDNYLNKTLVHTGDNQEKGNKTPYEWLSKTEKWTLYENNINNLNITQQKKDIYLLKELDFDTEREMREQNLNDTKYISKELAALIKAYLNVEKVNVYQGAITAKLRARWGFNRLTHSHISSNYIMPEELKKDIKKDRDNHLHHAMDALIIATITPSLQQKITLYEKFSRYIDGQTEKELKNFDKVIEDNKLIYYDDKGEVIDEIEFKEYLKEELSKEHIYFKKHNIAKLEFPLPYKNFDIEAKTRVYEQDNEILKWQLKQIGTYTKEEIEKVKVLTPSIAKAKISGAMHQETYYGIKQIGQSTYKTIRKPLNSVKKSDIENIPDRQNGSKDIYNAILTWFGDSETGEEALKKNNGKYPVNPNDKEKKEIKKIKLYSEYKNNGHIINKANVEKGGIYRIDIIKSKDQNDDKLYFAAYDIYEIKKINAIKKGKDEDFNIKLYYGQKDNNVTISYKEMINKYQIITTLTKNDLVRIVLKDNRESTAYIVGGSDGKIEIKSKLGDGYDLIGNNNIRDTITDRFMISISTIKRVEKLSINVLGEISGV